MNEPYFKPPPPKALPYGHVDVVQPFEAPEHFDKNQRRRVERQVDELAASCGLRHALTEDLAKRPGSYLIRVVGTEADVNVFRAKLAGLKTD